MIYLPTKKFSFSFFTVNMYFIILLFENKQQYLLIPYSKAEDRSTSIQII